MLFQAVPANTFSFLGSRRSRKHLESVHLRYRNTDPDLSGILRGALYDETFPFSREVFLPVGLEETKIDIDWSCVGIRFTLINAEPLGPIGVSFVRSFGAQVKELEMREVKASYDAAAAAVSKAIERRQKQFAGEFLSMSPGLEKLIGRNQQEISGGTEITAPLQYEREKYLKDLVVDVDTEAVTVTSTDGRGIVKQNDTGSINVSGNAEPIDFYSTTPTAERMSPKFELLWKWLDIGMDPRPLPQVQAAPEKRPKVPEIAPVEHRRRMSNEKL